MLCTAPHSCCPPACLLWGHAHAPACPPACTLPSTAWLPCCLLQTPLPACTPTCPAPFQLPAASLPACTWPQLGCSARLPYPGSCCDAGVADDARIQDLQACTAGAGLDHQRAPGHGRQGGGVQVGTAPQACLPPFKATRLLPVTPHRQAQPAGRVLHAPSVLAGRTLYQCCLCCAGMHVCSGLASNAQFLRQALCSDCHSVTVAAFGTRWAGKRQMSL